MNPAPTRNNETPTTDTLLAHWWVASRWGHIFRRRQELGVKRYGMPLQPFNGRDAILDAAEEFQDAALYTEQCIREGRLPVFAGAVLQVLCLFALRVLWYYADIDSKHRIVGLPPQPPASLPEEEPKTEGVCQYHPVGVPAEADGLEEEASDVRGSEPTGFWAQNGPVYNGQHSWQWVGGGTNKGHSASRLLDSLWDRNRRRDDGREA